MDQWEEGDTLYIQAGAAQEWAIKENQEKRQRTMDDIPDKYQRHWLVFDEDASCHGSKGPWLEVSSQVLDRSAQASQNM